MSFAAIYATRIFFSTNMVTTWVLENLLMRKQNANRAVPLDVVPERRTEWSSPRFRLAFRVSQGSDTCRQAVKEKNVGS